jgi:cytochrome c oxidase accessory protein FixG
MTAPSTDDRVLSTLNRDGSRHWIHPKLSHGRFLRRRQVVGYALIALFVALPLIEIEGQPALLIDLVSRELVAFGAVWKPTDGFVLMWLGLTIALTVFLVTALFGRVWCGWGCPQSVYLEHVFRPIERWLEGSPGQQRALDARGGLHPRRVAKWLIYAALSFALANVFLAYFVGAARLRLWVLESPLDHPVGFSAVMVVSALMLFDFAYFREQTCIVACPYGRLQSALIDRQSLVIGYDRRRGEPRGKPARKLAVLPEAREGREGTDPPATGDCIDCGACVVTCPTGIDIRDGIQMECIGCAQCIDACDAVMDKLARPRGLVGYTSQDRLAGKQRRLLRARTVLYPAALAIVGSLLVWSVADRAAATVWVERVDRTPFIELPDGRVAAQARLQIENETAAVRYYTVDLLPIAGGALRIPQERWRVEPQRRATVPLFVELPRAAFVGGVRVVQVRVTGDDGFRHDLAVALLGPSAGAAAAPPAAPAAEGAP